MSELDRALDSEIDSFRPSAMPPFVGLRRRARRRRQARWGGSSVLALGMLSAVALLVPGQLGGADRVVDVAGGSATPTVTTSDGPLRVIEAGFDDHFRSRPSKFVLDYRPQMKRCADGATVTQLPPNDPLLLQSEQAVIGYAVTLPSGDTERYQRIYSCLESTGGLADIRGGDSAVPPARYSYEVGRELAPVKAESLTDLDVAADGPATEEAIGDCLALPGGDAGIVSDVLPAIHATTRIGQMEALAFTRCIGDLPNVRITQTSTTAPAPSTAATACLSARAEPASEYVGLPEAFTQYRDVAGPPVRVVGRDGACVPRARRLLRGGIDVVLDQGIVVVAERDALPRR